MDSWTPYGKALKAYWQGDKNAKLNIHMNDGSITKMPMSVYFREESEMPELETFALELCKGRVLDVGAGAGPHSQILLSKGHNVVSIDVASEAIEILKEKGIKQAFQTSYLDFKSDKPFDTLLFLMNGIGIAQNLEGLKQHFQHAHSLTHQNSQIILDSSDLSFNPEIDLNTAHYFGEINYRLSYDNETGSSYKWLYVDPETLDDIAAQTNWHCQTVFHEDDGSYLCRLTKHS